MKMGQSTRKIEWISFLQVFAILLVVIGHSFYHHEENALYKWIYSFHMPLFFFISGALLRFSVQKSGRPLSEVLNLKALARKARRLLLPYWALSSLVFIPKAFLSQYAGRPVDLSFSGYLHMLLYPNENVISIFWFLPTLFFVFFLVFAGAQLSRVLPLGRLSLLSLPGTLLLTFLFPRYSLELLNYPGVLAFLFYFVLGYFAGGVKSLWKGEGAIFGKHTLAIALAVIAGYAALFFIPGMNWRTPDLDWQAALFATSGIAFSMALSQLYCRSGVRFFRPFYGSTYTIYLYSWFFQVASQQVFLSVTGFHWGVGSVLAALSGFFGPFAIYKIRMHFQDREARGKGGTPSR